MKTPTKNLDITKFILIVVALLLLSWYFFSIVSYVIVAVILAAILKTPANYFSQVQIYGARIPRVLAISASFAILFGFLALFIYLFVPLVSDQVQKIGGYNFDNIINQVVVPLDAFEEFLINYNIVEDEKGFLKGNVKDFITNFISPPDQIEDNLVNKVLSFTGDLISVTGNVFIGFLAVMFITFFLLYEKGLLRKNFISVIPNRYFEVSIAALTKTEKLLSNYLLGLLLQMISIFSIASFGLLIVGVEYALTIAVFAAVANIIPFLGPILGATFGLFVGLSTNMGVEDSDNLILIFKILSVFGVVQLTDNIFLQPIIFSKSVKAHPLEIFLIVFAGATLSGPIGMIAAIPAYTILRVSFSEFYRGYRQYQVFRN